MRIAFRTAANDDIERIIKLQEKQDGFPCYLGYEPIDEQRSVMADFYRKLDLEKSIEPSGRQRIILAENEKNDKLIGYMLVEVALPEAFGLFKRTHIRDWFVAHKSDWDYVMEEFIYNVEELALHEGCRDISAEVPISLKAEEDFFRDCDFYPEMNRILKPVSSHNLDTMLVKKYTTRLANESDRLFILSLSAGNASAIIPPGMDGLEKDIRESYFNLYAGMNLEENKNLRVFIVEDPKEYRPIGFIIIMTDTESVISAKSSGYIYDLSVHPDYWGRYATQRIMREAENILASEGCGYYFGDISELNPRALKTSIRTLDFKLYGRKWVKNITNITTED
jgi:ribosomal protein S18 acetylase RimI-like enzyme